MTDQSPLPRPELSELLAELAARFGSRLDTGLAMRQQHGHTTSYIPSEIPDAVVFAESTAEVSDIVRLCAAHRVPVIPFGTGTSLEGHVNAPHGGICLDTSRMNRVLAIHAEDMDVVVQPGVTRSQLNTELRATGLFFPVDPGADASLGGMASTRASGTNAVRYGTMKDLVLAVEAVMPSGEIIRTARRAKKTAAGYDLTHLMIGAEGTLGVITELTLKLVGQPEVIGGAIASFTSIDAACRTVIETVQMGLPVARIEFMDTHGVQAVNAKHGIGLPEMPLLLVELHGSEAGVAEQAETFSDLAQGNGATAVEWSTDPDRRAALWKARHDYYWSALAYHPGMIGLSTDVCVPVSALADCVNAAAGKLDKLGLTGTNAGHVGDGNFHTLVMMDPDRPEDLARAKTYMAFLADLAHAHDGTCTGEHGVGQGKMKYLDAELGSGAVDAMRAIKRALDPLNIMNPGKIFSL